MHTSANEQHLKTLQGELLRRYDTLTKRIAALDTDIGRELDSERKLVLQERRADLVVERDQNVAEMKRIESEAASVYATMANAVVGHASGLQEDATPQLRTTTVSSTQQPPDPASLAWLQGRIDMHLREGRISAVERETLHAVYRLALSTIEVPEVLGETESNLHLCNIGEGEAMAAQNTNIVNLAESLFAGTSHTAWRETWLR